MKIGHSFRGKTPRQFFVDCQKINFFYHALEIKVTFKKANSMTLSEEQHSETKSDSVKRKNI